MAVRKDKTVREVVAEYNDTHEQVMSLAARIPVETFRQTGTLPWYGMEYALDDFIVYTNMGINASTALRSLRFATTCERGAENLPLERGVAS